MAIIWYGTLAVIGIALLPAVTAPNSVNSFFAFSGAFAGIWTLYVYPIAKRVFIDTEERADGDRRDSGAGELK